jgi:hypothetical protein
MAWHERWTAAISAGLIFGALLACKKKGAETTPEPSASAVAAPAPPPPATQAAVPIEGPKLGDVKRYADKEKKSDEGAVRVLAEGLKVFNEADGKTPEVATLPKDALVFRLAEVDGFQLVEFPSGVGQFSQGWVEVKGLADKPEKVARQAVLDEKKVASVKVDAGAPASSATTKPSASASAKASSSASAKASASASASAKPSASVATESDAEKRIKEAERRAEEAEKKAREAEKKRRAAEKKAREAEKKAKDK